MGEFKFPTEHLAEFRRKAEEAATLRAESCYPPGQDRDAMVNRLSALYYMQYVTSVPERCPCCGRQ